MSSRKQASLLWERMDNWKGIHVLYLHRKNKPSLLTYLNLFAAVLRLNLKSPETEGSSPYLLVYPNFIALLKPCLSCEKSNKNVSVNLLHSRNYSKRSIKLFNHYPTTLWGTYHYYHCADKKNWGIRAVWLFIKSYWVTEHKYESTQYGG